MVPPHSIAETNAVKEKAQSAMAEMERFVLVDSRAKLTVKTEPAVETFPEQAPSSWMTLFSNNLWTRVPQYDTSKCPEQERGIEMKDVGRSNHEKQEEQDGRTERFLDEEAIEEGTERTNRAPNYPTSPPLEGGSLPTTAPPLVVRPPLEFLHRMLDVQEELLQWLTRLAASEINSEQHIPTYLEVECIKTISMFHHELLPIMEHIYTQHFQDRDAYDVFVCSTGLDNPSYAHPVVQFLESTGKRVFVDREDPGHGPGTRERIDEIMWAATTAKVFWCIASPPCVQQCLPMRELQVAYARHVQGQDDTGKFRLIMDCFEGPHHSSFWMYNSLSWADCILNKVQSLRLYSVEKSIGACKSYEFPSVYAARAEESFDERINRIAAADTGMHWGGSFLKRRSARFSIIAMVLIVVAVLVIGNTQLDSATGGYPSNTPSGKRPEDSLGNESGEQRTTCYAGGEPPASIIPDFPLDLFGRETEMETLATMHDSEKMLSIVGGAGVGKTHLAAHYVKTWLDRDSSKRRVYWLQAASEDNILPAYVALLSHFGCWSTMTAIGSDSTSHLAEQVWEQLAKIPTTFEWLVVYDNAPEALCDKGRPATVQSFFFPPAPVYEWSQGKVLFTTRSAAYGGQTCLGYIKSLWLLPPHEDAAITMLLANTLDAGEETSKRAAQHVAHRFGYLPLALVTANGIIVDKGERVQDYLASMGSARDGEDEIDNAIAAAIENALDYASSAGLGSVLEIISYLDPDQMSLSLVGHKPDLVNRLLKLNLLRRVGDGVYSMHRMHQEPARSGRSVLNAVRAVDAEFEKFNVLSFATWESGTRLIPHAAALERNTPPTPVSEDLFLPLSNILHLAGAVLFELREYERTKLFCEKSINMKRKVYGAGAKNLDLAKTLLYLGLVEFETEDFEKAQLYFEELLEMYRHEYGADAQNTDLAKALNHLGLVEHATGHNVKARSYFQRSLEMYRHMYGAGTRNADLAAPIENLGLVEYAAGNYEKARLYFVEALEMYQYVYGPGAKNIKLAITLENLGAVEYYTGKLEKARSHSQEALDMYYFVYGAGAKNVDLARTLNLLGLVAYETGGFEKARSYCEDALEMYHYVFGVDAKNVHLAVTLRNFGLVELGIHNYEKAWSYFQESSEMYHHVYGAGAKNVDLAVTLETLGLAKVVTRNYEEALSYFQQALEMFRSVYGADAKNLDLAGTLNYLGIVEYGIRDFEKSQSYHLQALEMYHSVYGADAKNVHLAKTLDYLGVIEFNTGNYEKALSYFEEAMEMYYYEYGDDAKNANLAQVLNNVGLLQFHARNYEKAQLHFLQALEMYQHVYGANAKTVDLARTLNDLGLVEHATKNYEKARSYFLQALSMYQHVYGAGAKNTDLANTLIDLGGVEYASRKYKEARSYYLQALEMFHYVYGPDAKNVDLARTLRGLGLVEYHTWGYEKARSYFEESLEMFHYVYGPDAKNVDLARTLNDLGLVEYTTHNYEKARSYFEEAVELYRHVYGPDSGNAELTTAETNLRRAKAKLGV